MITKHQLLVVRKWRVRRTGVASVVGTRLEQSCMKNMSEWGTRCLGVLVTTETRQLGAVRFVVILSIVRVKFGRESEGQWVCWCEQLLQLHDL